MARRNNKLYLALLALAPACLAAGPVYAATTTVSSQVCSSSPPSTPTITVPSDDYKGSAVPLYIQGKAESGADLSAMDDGAVSATTTVPTNGIYSLPLYLEPGRHSIQVTTTDVCGYTLKSSVITVTQQMAPSYPQPAQPLPSSGGSQGPLQVTQAITEPQPSVSYSLGTPNTNIDTGTPDSGGIQVHEPTVPAVPLTEGTDVTSVVPVAVAAGSAALGYLILAGKLSLVIGKIARWMR